MEAWIQIQKPKEEAKSHKGRGRWEDCHSQVDIRVQTSIIIVLQLNRGEMRLRGLFPVLGLRHMVRILLDVKRMM